jgi:RHS repeat-associated protein
VYDGNGIRVQKCVPNCTSPTTKTAYIFAGNQVIAEYDNGAAPSTPSREYIYGTTLLAKIESGGTIYYHQDHLSNRMLTDSTGNVIGQSGHFPFGESWYQSGTATEWFFTSYERDAESGNDYAMARSYVSRLARFSSTDPLFGSIANPQSLNRYAYTINDPINLIDPLGQVCIWDDGSFDSQGDPQSGTKELCTGLGGTWTSLDLGGWSDQPNAEIAAFAAWLNSPYSVTVQDQDGGLIPGIRDPNDTFKQCMEKNAHTYSAGGAIELGLNVATNTNTNFSSNWALDFLGGNIVNSSIWGGSANEAGRAGASQVPALVDAGMGEVLTYGRRGSGLKSLNLAGKGGLPKALSEAGARTATKSVFSRAANALNLGLRVSIRLGIDIGLTGSEMIGCSIPRS